MEMVCKCGGKEFFTEEHGNQTGLYCSACGKLVKMAQEGRDTTFQSWCQGGERFSAGTSQGSYRGECNQGICR